MVSKKNKFISFKTKKIKKIGLNIIPGLTQTLAKSPTQFSEDFSPIFAQSGKGAFIMDYEKNSFIDTIMGVGPIILGYKNASINNAIKKQLDKGIIFSLINPLEIKFAQELNRLIPNLEMFRFSKTGADATSAAIRAARSFTSKNKILSCGYHGWHDWNAITLNKNSGILQENKKYIRKFSYNDFEYFADNLDSDVAAVIMEPIIFDFPTNKFLEKIRQTCEHRSLQAKKEIDYTKVEHGPVNRIFGNDFFSRYFGAAGFNKHLLHHIDPSISYTSFKEMENFLIDSNLSNQILSNRFSYLKIFKTLYNQ